MNEPIEELRTMPGDLKPGASMNKPIKRSDRAVLGYLVGKDTGRNGCIKGQDTEVGQNPPLTPPPCGTCRGGVEDTSKTCMPSEAVRK